MDYPFALYDLEEKIMDCWNVTNDIKVLNTGLQDNGLPFSEVKTGLIGLNVLYEIKFQTLFEQYSQFFKDGKAPVTPFPIHDLEEKIMDSWKITDEMSLLGKAITEKNMKLDDIANVLLGLEYLYDLKFQYLFDQFTLLHSKKE